MRFIRNYTALPVPQVAASAESSTKRTDLYTYFMEFVEGDLLEKIWLKPFV